MSILLQENIRLRYTTELTSPTERLSDGGQGPWGQASELREARGCLHLPLDPALPRITARPWSSPDGAWTPSLCRCVGDTSLPAPPALGTQTQILLRLDGYLRPFSRLSGPSPPAGLRHQLPLGSDHSGIAVVDGRPTACKTQRGQWRLQSPCIQGAVPSTPLEQQWDPTRMGTSPRGDHLAPLQVGGGEASRGPS